MSADPARFVPLGTVPTGRRPASDPRRLHLVDLTTGHGSDPGPAPPSTGHGDVPLRFDEADLARACAAAARRALDASARRAAELAAAAEAGLQQALGAALETLVAERGERLALAERTGRSLAMAVVRRCLSRPRPELDLEIERLVGTALEQIDGRARLDVHLAPDDLERVGARLPALAAAAGFEGDLHCHADPSLVTGSVRLGWGDAWAERDVAGWLRRLEERIEAHRGAAPEDRADGTRRETLE